MKDSEALRKHFEWKGKVDIHVKSPVRTEEELSVAYTPGVADACMAIYEDPSLSYKLTGRGNQVAVITDGTAILGLGNIGPEAGMPVMEGKAALFKTFGNIDAIPLCLKTTDKDEIIKTVKYLSGNFAGINLEDISAPRCFEIETTLNKELGIPVFHDDQHGTAIVAGAGLLNALKIVGKKIKDINVVINGGGAAGTAITKYMMKLGVKHVLVCGRNGILNLDEEYKNPVHHELAVLTNKKNRKGTLADALVGADVFIGVSAPNVVTKDMVRSMAKDAIVFALANPVAEISYEDAKEAGARIVGTGSSKHPNQVNNALVFPGLFRGAIDGKAKSVTPEMMIATTKAIASSVKKADLCEECILPKVVNKAVHRKIAKAVEKMARKQFPEDAQ